MNCAGMYSATSMLCLTHKLLWTLTLRMTASNHSTQYWDDLCWLQVDAGEAVRMLDKGPSPGSPAAAAFRQFWGDKAELRRFQVWLAASVGRALTTLSLPRPAD